MLQSYIAPLYSQGSFGRIPQIELSYSSKFGVWLDFRNQSRALDLSHHYPSNHNNPSTTTTFSHEFLFSFLCFSFSTSPEIPHHSYTPSRFSHPNQNQLLSSTSHSLQQHHNNMIHMRKMKKHNENNLQCHHSIPALTLPSCYFSLSTHYSPPLASVSVTWVKTQDTKLGVLTIHRTMIPIIFGRPNTGIP